MTLELPPLLMLAETEASYCPRSGVGEPVFVFWFLSSPPNPLWPSPSFPKFKKKGKKEKVAGMFLNFWWWGWRSPGVVAKKKKKQEFPFLKRQRGERKLPLCEDISKSKMMATWLNKYKGQQPHEAAKAWTLELESFPLWFSLAAVWLCACYLIFLFFYSLICKMIKLESRCGENLTK